jgi:capsular polysaccharide biosynthesis protein
MIVPPLLLAILGALLATHAQDATLRAKSQVLINRTSDGFPLPTPGGDPQILIAQESFLTTQARIARRPELARRVVAAAAVRGLAPNEFLHRSRAKLQSDAAILDLSVSYPKAAAAVRIANAYANQFTRYKIELDVAQIKEALHAIRRELLSLRDRGVRESDSYDALVQQRIQLETVGHLIANNVKVLQPASSATSVRPHALRNGILGGVLGALLGVALVVGVAARRQKQP